MATIEIDPRFEKWVQEKVVKSFGREGIEVTQTAQPGLAYLMQAQLQENTVRREELVLEGAEKLLAPILRAHRARYRRAPLTINRALHLLTEANAFLWAFPWGTTMEWTEIKGKDAFLSEGELEEEGQH